MSSSRSDWLKLVIVTLMIWWATFGVALGTAVGLDRLHHVDALVTWPKSE